MRAASRPVSVLPPGAANASSSIAWLCLSSLAPRGLHSRQSCLCSLVLVLMVILSLGSSAVGVDDFARGARSVHAQDNAARAEGSNNKYVGRQRNGVIQDINQPPAQNLGTNNNNNNNNQPGDLPAGKQSRGGFTLDPALQKNLDKRKEKTVEEARRDEEIRRQIEEHEKKLAARQQQMEERERQRKERDKILNEHRQKQEKFQQQQRDKDEQDRARSEQREREREQKWVLDVQRRSQEKLSERKQQLGQSASEEPGTHQQDEPARQPPLAVHDVPDPARNTGDIHAPPVNPPANLAGNVGVGNGNQDQNRMENNVVNKTYNIQGQPGTVNKDNEALAAAAANNNQNNFGNGIVLSDDKHRASNNELRNEEFTQKPNLAALDQTNHDSGTNGQGEGNNKDSNFNNILGMPLNVNNNDNGNAGNVDPNIMVNADPNRDINNNQWNRNGMDGQQQQQQTQEQPGPPQVGGMNLNWDWEDFSITFNNYGAAEMKVRRSPHPTTGEPWPMPQYYSKKDNKVYRVSKDLRFIPTGVMCDILEEGLPRHLQRILKGCVEDMYDNLQNAEGTFVDDPTLRYEKEEFLKAPLINRVEVQVRKPCDKYPSLESDESYDLVVKKKKTYIWANEVWGALRGLETFGHLVWRGTDGHLYIKETVISDYPRFPHRGIHMDTSRHFLFKEVILDILDSMEMNKLNVLHWHIVDDQSFPYESKVYPEMSRKGAFHPTYVYTLEDIAEIVEYARFRAIRVMPEFDTPGHTYSWGLSRPELLTQCYSGNSPVKGYLGPIDPSKNATYRFLQTLFQEVMEVFKDQYLHLGGDEVPLGCWQSNPEITAFAQELARKPKITAQQTQQSQYYPNNNFGGWSMWSDEIRKVYEYYENRLMSILDGLGQKRKKGVKYIMWQEVINNNLQLSNDTIIQVWMGDMGDVMRITSLGYQVLYSTCWYMDHVEYGTKWPKYYSCDPVDQSFGYHIDEKKVLGGEAAFWAEYFSNENLIPLMWPRASAAAERLWSHKDVKNVDKAAERLAEHRCRMIKRGINAGEISGPGYCLHAPPKRRLFNDTAGCKGGNCSRTHNFVQIEDIELHLSQRGGSIADCGNVFTHGNGNVFIMLILALVVVAALYALSRSSNRFHRIRICKNRSILIVFVVVLLVYFLCYTTIWMRAFEFSGSFHKTLQEDNRSGMSGSTGGEDENVNDGSVSS